MLSVLLVAAAAALFFGVDAEKLRKVADAVKARFDAKTALAFGLVLLAALLLPSWGGRDDGPTPVPDAGPLSLKGDFRGDTASSDAAIIGSLLKELADEIEYDGMQSEPAIRTGTQIDQLRKAARTLRCRGESVGERQPVARDKIAAYLEAHVGTDGGPLTPETRSLWVSAFRDVGEAASDAAQ
jgi:hypothetical protein